MSREILLLSDTHGYVDDDILRHARSSDEAWHAGDFGNATVSERLAAVTRLRGVYGNVDGQDIRAAHPFSLRFTVEGLNVFMIHIGGYPGRYAPGVEKALRASATDLFISGHSHIVRVMRDPADKKLIHINPGAAGKEGFHRVRTVVRFSVTEGRIADLRVVELGPR